MPEPVKGDQKYLPGLDGLRALAVAFVVAYHLGYGWAQGGLLGVGVFFTLSGYLITDILVGQWAARGRIRLGEFWLRRARRLLPALFLMLAVVAVWVNAFARSFVPGFRGDVVASALYVSNWWYIGQHASYYARFAPPGPLDHLWSLAVEEQFYLLWPWVVLLMVWLVGRKHRRGGGLIAALGGLATSGAAHAGASAGTGAGIGAAGAGAGAGADATTTAGAGAAGAGAAGAPGLSGRARLTMAGVTLALAAASAVWMAVRYQPGYDPTRIYEGTDTRAFGLLIGAAVAMVWPTRRAVAARPLPAAARWLLDLGGLAGLVVVCLMVWRTNQYSGFMFEGGLELLSVATALAVAAAVTPGSLFGRALGIRPLRWLGVRSYGIYLWHYPLIVLTAGAAAAASPASLPRAIAIVAGTIAIAAFSWHFVEDPIRTGKPARLRPARPISGKAIFTPGVISVLCLVLALVLAGGVTMATRLTADTGTNSAAGNAAGGVSAGPANAADAADAAEPAQLSKSGNAATGAAAAKAGKNTAQQKTNGAAITSAANVSGGTTGSGTVSSYATVPALPTPPPQTSCTSVVHIGDSTSDGLISSDYEPNPANLITSRYADVGVKHSIMKVVGATSVVESLPGTPNAYQMATQVKQEGFHGCWVLALGTNDTADVYVGSNVGRVQRIEKMMKLIAGQPVMWVEVTSLLSSGPYSEQNMELWNQALKQVLPQYPNMRIYNWPAVAQKSWFINDGIHYTSLGYLYRGKDIADALAEAFPAS
jgi:peptidoglycan/LPS O-acetylase OafA/YrhL